MNESLNQVGINNENRPKNNWSLRISLLVLMLIIVSMLYGCGMFDGIILSKYDGKTYIVKSVDGKLSGTITTTVSVCSETSQCVHADYNLILSDNIPPKKVSYSDAYLDQNYFYAVNIYNNKLNPNEYSYDSNIKPIGKDFPANKFLISFKKILRGRTCATGESNKYYCFGHPADDFLKLTHLDIYDASAYIKNEFGSTDQFASFKSSDKIRTYDFTVTPQ